jgi:hypothetical protein
MENGLQKVQGAALKGRPFLIWNTLLSQNVEVWLSH